MGDTITWPEFVSAFVPLGQWDLEEEADAGEKQEARGRHAAEHGQGGREGGAVREGERGQGRELRNGSQLSAQRLESKAIKAVETQGGFVSREDLQMLRVAYSMTAVGAGRGDEEGFGAGVVVSLAELRAASAALDGEEPPEEPVRKALKVTNNLFFHLFSI